MNPLKGGAICLMLCLLVLMLINGCTSKTNNQSKPDKQEEKAPYKSCDELIDTLIRTSSYKNHLGEKQVSYDIDNITDGVILVKASHKNEEGNDVAVGWVEIDLNKNTVADRDATFDEDTTVLVPSFDKSLLEQVRKHCKNDNP